MSSRKRPGLGQGLGALIPSASGTTQPQRTNEPSNTGQTGLRQIPIDSILPNPFQPRTDSKEETKLQELADSIREQGILQPLIVTFEEEGAIGERFRLIAGERRWRAAKRVGLSHVPAIVREASEQEMLEWALIENIQREDLNAYEEALAYQQMVEYSNLTQGEIARRVGKNRTTVNNTLRLLKLPEPVQNMLRSGELTEGHARAILGLEEDHFSQIIPVAERVVKEKLNVRQTEDLVKRIREPSVQRAQPDNRISVYDNDLQRRFTSALGTQVELKRQKKGGQVVIHFKNDEDLQSLYEKLLGE
jgi:ParB family transcriptional regulator, chromosome partitioning protein